MSTQGSSECKASPQRVGTSALIARHCNLPQLGLALTAIGLAALIQASLHFAVEWVSADVKPDFFAGDDATDFCEKRVREGACLRQPLQMNSRCLGHCEDDHLTSHLKERTLFDDLATDGDCRAVLRLAKEAAVLGDGYGGDAHPFSIHERFLGLTPANAARWAVAQPPEARERWADNAVRTFIALARETRKATQAHFNSTVGSIGELYDDYIHLSCREAEDGEVPDDEHTPPPKTFIYADNCYRQGDFECIQGSPFYYWRTYSAAMFLHSEFDEEVYGGRFHYSSDWDGSKTTTVLPQCGRVAAYNAGPANLHGVEFQTKGRSCMLTVYMTDDESRAAHRDELEEAALILEGHQDEDEEVEDTASKESFVNKFYKTCARSSFQDTLPDEVAKTLPQYHLELDGRKMLVTEVSAAPQLSVIDNFLSTEEMEHLIRLGQPFLKASTVFEQGQLTIAKYRNSRTAWLSEDQVDEITDRVERRVTLLTGLNLRSAEQAQIAYYAAGDQGRYEPHFDWGSTDDVRRNFYSLETNDTLGARIATFLIYLRDVPGGGHTFFTETDLMVSPKAGRAVFWYNLDSEAFGDILTRHGACPVVQGDKYVYTKWIHEVGNMHLFNAASAGSESDRDYLQRDWGRIAEDLRNLEESDDSPMYLWETCEARRSAGSCSILDEWEDLESSCPGICREQL
mmetsp:Transcript_50307/g.106921  ORF Transcript_50307/g.106921 Transcript_50307/m.106921 type:complete len:685 (-) Transcript_50307:40-2094(-)